MHKIIKNLIANKSGQVLGHAVDQIKKEQEKRGEQSQEQARGGRSPEVPGVTTADILLAGPSGDESGAATQNPNIGTTSSGQINVNNCTRLRGLTHTGETWSRNSIPSPTQLTFFPIFSENQPPVTPHHHIVSLLPYLERQRSPSDSEGTRSPTYTFYPDQPSPSRNKGPIKQLTFALRAAHFMPKRDESTPSSPTTASSLTTTRPTPTPYTTNVALPVMSSREQPWAVTLFRGDYGDREEPTEWFVQFELSLPESWTDTQKIDHFIMQLVPGQMAEEWYQSLKSLQTNTFTILKSTFRKRWPPPKQPKYSHAQQKE
ncbi:uncharacterized protein EDB91DRAFT_1086968 [Suillus paluster]|uniref:uncharacterized protein n=1 Tax=Suillus paluster TaxID=48578 RepID=UPI001B864A52|nr:uncharacterized protein EDB91DRAFT_1086968 [Suillus paluster]KAG1725900.1 hypothetical protein EDB91DRAFT_1086968 [Suillus paluster]